MKGRSHATRGGGPPKKRRLAPVPKGRAGGGPVPLREWTSRDVSAERRLLSTQLVDAIVRRDLAEVERITARLRLLER